MQACRGGRFDFGVESESTDLGEDAIKTLSEEKYDDIEKKVSLVLLTVIKSSLSFILRFLILPRFSLRERTQKRKQTEEEVLWVLYRSSLISC